MEIDNWSNWNTWKLYLNLMNKNLLYHFLMDNIEDMTLDQFIVHCTMFQHENKYYDNINLFDVNFFEVYSKIKQHVIKGK